MPLLSPIVRRSLGVGCAAILFVILAGATYQGVATALEHATEDFIARLSLHPAAALDLPELQSARVTA